MAETRNLTAFDVATLARELRNAAGAEEETFSPEKVVSMMQDEIRLLRERGFSDNKIADLLNGFDVPVKAEDLNDLINQPAWGDNEARS